MCEILDPRTQKTISANQVISTASDFCESNKLVAALLSMIAEERSVKVLLDELLGIGGCNLSLRPARNYCRPDEEISFNALSKRALQSGQILLGYQHQGKEKRRAGVAEARKSINPTHKRELQGGWSDYDMVVLEGEAMGFDYDEAQKEEATNDAKKRSMNVLGAFGGGGFGGRGRPNLLSAFKEREQRKGLADIGKERRINAKAKGARDQFQHVLHTHQKLKQIGKSKSAKKNPFAGAGGGGVKFKVASLADEEGQGLSGQEEQEAREKAIEKQDQMFEKMRRRKSSFVVAGKKQTMSEGGLSLLRLLFFQILQRKQRAKHRHRHPRSPQPPPPPRAKEKRARALGYRWCRGQRWCAGPQFVHGPGNASDSVLRGRDAWGGD